ncbi:nicotinate phosphoribosyltransferase, partial [Halomonas elongata]|nr:nicotinate phosphoribosyltransferase [Halomonas elongata]
DERLGHGSPLLVRSVSRGQPAPDGMTLAASARERVMEARGRFPESLTRLEPGASDYPVTLSEGLAAWR